MAQGSADMDQTGDPSDGSVGTASFGHRVAMPGLRIGSTASPAVTISSGVQASPPMQGVQLFSSPEGGGEVASSSRGRGAPSVSPRDTSPHPVARRSRSPTPGRRTDGGSQRERSGNTRVATLRDGLSPRSMVDAPLPHVQSGAAQPSAPAGAELSELQLMLQAVSCW